MTGGCLSIPNSETVSPRYFRNKSQGGARSEMEQINFVKLRMDKPVEEAAKEAVQAIVEITDRMVAEMNQQKEKDGSENEGK